MELPSASVHTDTREHLFFFFAVSITNPLNVRDPNQGPSAQCQWCQQEMTELGEAEQKPFSSIRVGEE